jgi:hypothetical protein
VLLGFKEPWVVSWKNLQGLGQLFTGKAGISQMSGPVGIVQGVAQAAEEGPASYIKWLAMISALLGLFNLLPLPALDGGRMVFMLIESVLRRPVNRHVEEMIHGYGMAAGALGRGAVRAGRAPARRPGRVPHARPQGPRGLRGQGQGACARGCASTSTARHARVRAAARASSWATSRRW